MVFAISKKVRNHSQGVDYFGLSPLPPQDTAEIVLLGHSKHEGTHSERDLFQDTQQEHYRTWNSKKETWKLLGQTLISKTPK